MSFIWVGRAKGNSSIKEINVEIGVFEIVGKEECFIILTAFFSFYFGINYISVSLQNCEGVRY